MLAMNSNEGKQETADRWDMLQNLY